MPVRPCMQRAEGAEAFAYPLDIRQLTCKPGSVRPACADVAAIHLESGIAAGFMHSTRTTGLEIGWSLRSASSLFELAPGGVCRAVPVARPAVRSYRTLSSLPARRQAVCFLWHFPWGRPRRRR